MKKLIWFILTSALIFTLLGCQKKEDKQGSTEKQETEIPAVTQNEEIQNDKEKMTEITVNYGILHYPAEWEQILLIEESEDNGIDYIQFETKAGEDVILLFKVIICSEEGDSVGTITDSEGSVRNVFVEINDLGDLSEYDEETQNRLYAMQEAVNELMEQLN